MMSRFVISLRLKALKLLPVVLISTIVAGMVGPGIALANPGWYDTDWAYRKQITINSANVSGSTNLTDFPVLISITSDSDIGSHAQLDGDDIRFTAADEVTLLSHEIESFSSNGASANLTAWVKIPSLSPSTDTDIYIYYGNGSVGNTVDATDVWNSDYKMVQHMEETSGPSVNGSTSNAISGTAYNTPTFGAAGAANGAIDFDKASDEYIQLTASNQILNSDNFTVEAWFNTTTNHPAYGVGTMEGRIINLHRQSTASTAVSLYVEEDMIGLLYYTGSTHVWVKHTVNYHDGNDHHIAVTHGTSDNTYRLYYDGVSVNTSVDDFGDFGTFPAFIGAHEATTGQRYFDGTIDEVRAADTAHSADWIQTSYNNVNNPGDFLSFGAEENAPSIPTVTTGDATNVEEIEADLHGNITATGGEDADERGFEWDTDSGAPYSSNVTSTAGAPYGTGAFTFADVSPPFAKGELYYFRAMAHNSAGWGYGSEKTFLTKPDGPTGLTVADQGNNWIYLTWSNGTGSQKTMVRYATGDYPADETSGSEGYFDTGTSVNITGLDPGTLHFFRAWSYATEGGLEQYSDLYSQASGATTGSPTPSVIGGLVLPVNKATVLAPWLFLGVILSLVIAKIIVNLRRKRLPRIDTQDTKLPYHGYE